MANSRVRSTPALQRHTDNRATHRAEAFLAYAPKFVHDLRLDDIMKNDRSAETIETLKTACNELTEAQTFSAQHLDRNHRPLLFYLSNRWRDTAPSPPVQPAHMQYQDRLHSHLIYGQQQNRSLVNDGIEVNHYHRNHPYITYGISQPNMLRRYHEAAQELSADLQPVTPPSDRRHEMAVSPDNDNPRVMRYRDRTKPRKPLLKQERIGVHHLVHGWKQQGQPEKVCLAKDRPPFLAYATQGLFIAGEFTRSGTSAKAIRHYYEVTAGLARTLALMFKVLFPEVYAKYSTAFEAGVWERADPGPFLARAIVYKLQVELHQDEHEDGPFVSFPCGDYTGGDMFVPQLRARLAYVLCTTPTYLTYCMIGTALVMSASLPLGRSTMDSPNGSHLIKYQASC
jgi:hypothetical protein